MEPCDVVIPDSELNLKGCSRLRHSACFFKSPSSSAVTERLLPAGQDKELGLKNDLYMYIKPVLICPLLFLYLQCYYWRYRYSYLLSNWRPLSSRPNTSCFVRNSRQSEQPVFTKFIVGIDPGGHTHAHTQTHTHTHISNVLVLICHQILAQHLSLIFEPTHLMGQCVSVSH